MSATEASPVLVIRSLLRDHQQRNRSIVRIDMPPKVWDLLRKDPMARDPRVLDAERRQVFGIPVRVWDGVQKLYIESV